MENDRITLGLDVSKLTIDACLLFANGKKRKLKFANCNSGFIELLRFLQELPLEHIHACMEPTGRYSRKLAVFLAEVGIKLSMVNTNTVKDHGRSKNIRNKTDKIDAYLLADYCLMHNPQQWNPPSQNRMVLRDLQNRIANVEELIRQEENRLEAGFESVVVEEDVKESLGRLYVRKKMLIASARKLIQSDPVIARNFEILHSILGLGETSVIVLLSMIDFQHFQNGRKVGAYAGLAPIFHDSGTSIHSKQRISKAGNTRLRGALYFPAMAAMQHNPQFREFAQRLKAKGKKGKVIICAVMRKLLVLASTLIRKQAFYDPSYSL